MDWIIKNIEWLFSGIGVIVLGIIGKLLKRKKSPIGNTSKSVGNTTNVNVNIDSSKSANTKVDEAQYNKESLQILFIDNEKFKTVDNLKSAGWVNTKSIKDVTNLDCIDVKNANVIFVDINGVGENLFPNDKGLGLAEALKKKYPKKYIVIYSAQEQGDRFHKALKTVDYTLSKNAEPYEFINILENCMK